MIASLAGAVSWAIGGVPLLAVTFVGVAGLAAMGYARTGEEDPGPTTETALLLTVLLAGFAVKEPVAASALAVTVAIALMARTRIHHFIRDVLSAEELTDALIFAAAALVVLPLVPRPIRRSLQRNQSSDCLAHRNSNHVNWHCRSHRSSFAGPAVWAARGRVCVWIRIERGNHRIHGRAGS